MLGQQKYSAFISQQLKSRRFWHFLFWYQPKENITNPYADLYCQQFSIKDKIIREVMVCMGQ